MKWQNNILIIRQLDKKLEGLRPVLDFMPPPEGWIKLIRKTLKMSLRQLGVRLSVSAQSVRDMEVREKEGSLTLKKLSEAAEALDMKLVYGFISKEGTLEDMIGREAFKIASTIVNRTSTSMKLEDQENSPERLKQAITELTEELKREMPKMLWD